MYREGRAKVGLGGSRDGEARNQKEVEHHAKMVGLGPPHLGLLGPFSSRAPHLTIGVGMALVTVGNRNQSRKEESITGSGQETQQQPLQPVEARAEFGFHMATTETHLKGCLRNKHPGERQDGN